MFRRRWSGLPEDPQFPAGIDKLGYFINEDDEIRSKADDNFYFKYFLSKNERVNFRQRFAFNAAVEAEVHQRISKLGLDKILVPLGTPDATRPHVPIFASKDIAAKKHVVVVFGEPCQDLGVLALRIMNGKGGIDKGSMVSLIRHIYAKGKKRHSDSDEDVDDDKPSDIGVVLANVGQAYWWPEGKRALCRPSVLGLPLPSAVHYGHEYDATANAAPGNATAAEHVTHMFDAVLPALLGPDAKVAVVAMSEGAHLVGSCFGNDERRWDQWKYKLAAMAIAGGCMNVFDITNTGFKEFLAKRARAYVWSERPKNTLLAGCQGNPQLRSFSSYGCPVFSSGEPALDELILVSARAEILDWLVDALTTPGGYCNPVDISLPSIEDLPVDSFNDDEAERDARALTDEDRKLLEKAWEIKVEKTETPLPADTAAEKEKVEEVSDPQPDIHGFPMIGVPEVEFRF